MSESLGTKCKLVKIGLLGASFGTGNIGHNVGLDDFFQTSVMPSAKVLKTLPPKYFKKKGIAKKNQKMVCKK